MIQKIGRSAQRPSHDRQRSLSYESLESRQLLTGVPTFDVIGNLNVAFDAPLHVALNGADGQDITYTVTTNNPNLQAEVLSGNRSWQLEVEGHGTMTFQFFEGRAPRTTGQIIDLIESDFYDSKEFIRVVEDFVIQATGAVSPLDDFDDEFHVDLNHGRYGTLSMAKAQEDDNNAEFFVTTGNARFLDSHHSVFGLLTEGAETLASINGVETTTRPGSSEQSVPVDPIVITSSELFTDTEDGVLFLKALSDPSEITGPIEVTVTATNNVSGEIFTETFDVTVTNDTFNARPFLADLDPLTLVTGESTNIELKAYDPEGDDILYLVPDPSPGLEIETVNQNVTPVGQEATLDLPVTAVDGFYGRAGLAFYVWDDTRQPTSPEDYSSFDRQFYWIDVVPESPTSVDLLPGSDSGPSDTDDDTDLASLTFRVSGVVEGRTVKLFVDGEEVGEAVVPTGETSVDITVDTQTNFVDGVNSVTARQTEAGLNYEDGGTEMTVVSLDSPALQVTVDKSNLGISPALPTSVLVTTPYIYDAAHSKEGQEGFVYSLFEEPTGMTIDPDTGVISWTPTSDQIGPHVVTVRATDSEGTIHELSDTVDVLFPAPLSVDLLAESDTGASDSDNITNQTTLSFEVTGVLPGATVKLYAGTTEIGSAEVPEGQTTVVVTTSNSEALTDGVQSITAKQEINPTSEASPALEITIDTAIGEITLDIDETVGVGRLLLISAAHDDEGDPGFAYSVESAPAGVQLNALQGYGSWVPTIAQAGLQSFDIVATDLAGNRAVVTANVEVIPPAPTNISLDPSSDSGASDSDNLTNVTTPSFRVAGVVPNAVVTVMLEDGTVLGTATAPDGTPGELVTVTVPFTGTALTEGEHSLKATQGFETPSSDSNLFSITIDLTAPAASTGEPAAETVAGEAFSFDPTHTNEGVSGYSYSLQNAPDGMTINASTGVVSWTPTNGQIGEQFFTINVIDPAGNMSPTVYSTEVLPPAPTGIDLLPGSDSGFDDSDNLTNLTTLSFLVSGVLPGATVTLFSGNTEIGSAEVAAGQTTVVVTTDNPGGLVEGVNSITATQTVNPTSSPSAALEVTIDLTAPAAFTETLPPEVEAGSLYVFNAANPEEGTPGFTYELTDAPNGATIDAETGVISWRPDIGQIGTPQVITVIARDAAGNETTITESVDVLIPTGPPASVELLSDSDTGSSDSDGITKITTPTFRVQSVAPGATVKLYANGVQIGEAIVPLEQAFVDIVPDAPLTEGTHLITATQTILVESAETEVAFDVEIDTTAPGPITPALPATVTAGEAYTYDAQNAEEGPGGLTYELVDPPAGATIDPSTGVVSWTPTNSQSGTQEITITGFDVAGNETSITQSIEVTPSAPTGIDLLESSDTGADNSDNITNLTTLSFLVSGVTSGATVTLHVGGTAVGSAEVANGQTTVVVTTDNPAALSEGENAFTATQTINPESEASAELVVTIDTGAPGPITPNLPASVIFGSSFTYDAENAEEGAFGFSYELVDPPEGMTIDAATGEVEWTPTADQIGNPTVTIKAVDLAGNETLISQTVEVNLPAPSSVDLLAESDSGVSDTDNITNQTILSFLVSGVTSGATVTIFAGETEIGSAEVAAGQTTVVVTTDNPDGLVEGANSITATQTVNPTSEASAALEVTIDTVSPAASTSDMPKFALRGILFEFNVDNAEEGTPGFIYSLQDPPDGMTIDPVTGQISWTPPAESTPNIDPLGNPLDILSYVNFFDQLYPEITILATDLAGNQTTAIDARIWLLDAVRDSQISVDEDSTWFETIQKQWTFYPLGEEVLPVSGLPPYIDYLGTDFSLVETANEAFDGLLFPFPTIPNLGEATLQLITEPSNGVVSFYPDQFNYIGFGMFDYAPNANYHGPDSFSYQLFYDGKPATIINVEVAVAEVNDLPYANDDDFIVSQSTIGNILNATNNDGTAPDDGETLNITKIDPPSRGGTAVISPDGKSVVYSPKGGFVGTETIRYTVSDGRGGEARGSITVAVEPSINQDPEETGNPGSNVQNLFVVDTTSTNENSEGGGNSNPIGVQATFVPAESNQPTNPNFLDGGGNGVAEANRAIYRNVYKIFTEMPEILDETVQRLNKGDGISITAEEAAAALEQLQKSLATDDTSNPFFDSEDAAVELPAEQVLNNLLQSGGSSSAGSLPAEFWSALEEALRKILDSTNGSSASESGPQAKADDEQGEEDSKTARVESTESLTVGTSQVASFQSLDESPNASLWQQVAGGTAAAGAISLGRRRERKVPENEATRRNRES